MLGKILGALIILGALFFVAAWFFTGLGPMDVVKMFRGPSGNDVTSANTDTFSYNYSISIGSPVNKVTEFTATFHVVKKTSDTICYTYRVTSVSRGDISDARSFMAQAYGTGEDQPVCTPLSTEDSGHKPWFPLVDSGTTVAARKSENGYSYSYKYVFGVLQSFDMKTVFQTSSGTKAPATIRMKFAGTMQRTAHADTATRTTTSTAIARQPSSRNVSSITYRFQWEIQKLDPATNKPAGMTNLDYTLRVDVVKRSSVKACIKYTITSIREGDRAAIGQLTQQALGYPENHVVCTSIAAEPSPQQIPYFLFSPELTKSDIHFKGNGISGVLAIKNGILYSMVLNAQNQVIDEDTGKTIATTPVKLTVTIISAK